MPRDRLIVITGLSGSGKSSLAFDTIYAEGQRRYVESLSAYARQFLGQMEKPDVDQIDGLSPAISIDQKGASRNPRSTVGTVTEIYDYLRLLFARIGRMHCPVCGREISRQTVEQIVDQLYDLPDGRGSCSWRRWSATGRASTRSSSPARSRAASSVSGSTASFATSTRRSTLDKKYKHSIEVVVDRLVIARTDADGTPPDASRMADSIETALRLGRPAARQPAGCAGEGAGPALQRALRLPRARRQLRGAGAAQLQLQLAARRVPGLHGLGSRLEIDADMVLPTGPVAGGRRDPAVAPHGRQRELVLRRSWTRWPSTTVPTDVPIAASSTSERSQILLHGNRGERVEVRYTARNGRTHTFRTTFEGIIPNLERRYRETGSER